jgi:nucleoside-diphosphate-sugar epimerase
MGVALRDYLRGRSPLLPSGAVYSWVHVSDVAFGHLLAMQRGRPGATYILAGAPHPLREVFIRAGRLIGRRHDPPTVPRFALGAAASGLRALQMVIPRLGPAAEWVRTIGGTGRVGDDTRARVELGFEPRSLDEGLPDTVRAHLDDLMEWIR